MNRRVATVRQLARDTAAILETVVGEGAPMTITRRGVPVAELRPLRLTPWAPTVEDVACGAPLPDVDIDGLDLDDYQRTLLVSCRDGFVPDEAARVLENATPSQISLTLAYMEMKGLARKTGLGYRFTGLGKDVAQVLIAERENNSP